MFSQTTSIYEVYFHYLKKFSYSEIAQWQVWGLSIGKIVGGGKEGRKERKEEKKKRRKKKARKEEKTKERNKGRKGEIKKEKKRRKKWREIDLTCGLSILNHSRCQSVMPTIPPEMSLSSFYLFFLWAFVNLAYVNFVYSYLYVFFLLFYANLLCFPFIVLCYLCSV